MQHKITTRVLASILSVMIIISMCMTGIPAFAQDNITKQDTVQTATLTIQYCFQNPDESEPPIGNLIYEPYIAQQRVGSEYSVVSPQIEEFKLVDESQSVISGTLTEDTSIQVYYTYAEETYPYTVTYRGYDKSTGETVVLDTVTGYAPADTKIAIEYKDFYGYDKEEVNDMFLTVSSDGNASATLNYVLKDDPYIIFRTQGSYIPPITTKPGTDIRSEIANIPTPVRPGYSFAGWEYNGQVYRDSIHLSTALDKMPLVLSYVNAQWTPDEAKYTVLTWFQNAEDDNYTLYSNIEIRRGMIGASVTATPQDIAKGDNDKNTTNNPYYGFNYSHCDETTIQPNGTAVLNLYFNREIWKINFIEKDNKTIWKTIEGKYMSLIGDKLPTQEELKEHYGSTFAYMAKSKGGNDSAMLEKFENSKSGTDKYGEQNIFPYFNNNIYQYQIRHFSYDPNVDSKEQILIRTSYIYYYKPTAPGMLLMPPEGFTWKGGWWKTASTEAELSTAAQKNNPTSQYQDGKVTFWDVSQYMDIYMQRDQSLLKYISNNETIQQIQNVPYEKNLDLSVVPKNGEEHMQFEGWYTNPNLMNFIEPLSEYQMPASDLNLYAKWGPVDYTVTFDTQGGSEIPQQTVKYNTSAEEPEQPSRPGYTFTGWYTQPEGGSIWAFEQTISGDTTLYAHWRKSVTAPFTINHIVVGKTEPFYTVNGHSTEGDTIYAKVLSADDGHYPTNTYLKPQDLSRTMVLSANSDNTINFYYQPIVSKSYSVSYLNEETEEELIPSQHLTTEYSVVTHLPLQIAGYECTNSDGFVTLQITPDGENQIIFYYRPTGEPVSQLNITKTVSGNQANLEDVFQFRVTIGADSEGKQLHGIFGDVTLTDGVGSFTLQAGETCQIKNLPTGVHYLVEEIQEDHTDEIAAHVHDETCGLIQTNSCNHVCTEECFQEVIQCIYSQSENQPVTLPSFPDENSPVTLPSFPDRDTAPLEPSDSVSAENEENEAEELPATTDLTADETLSVSENIEEDLTQDVPVPLTEDERNSLSPNQDLVSENIANKDTVTDNKESETLEDETDKEHICSIESGCITRVPNCIHQHDEACGYQQEVCPVIIRLTPYTVTSLNAEGELDTVEKEVWFHNYKGEDEVPELWKASIHFDANGGTGSTPSIELVNVETSITLSKNGFVRPDYNFIGWALNPTDSVSMYSDQQTISDPVTKFGLTQSNSNITLYAVWQKVVTPDPEPPTPDPEPPTPDPEPPTPDPEPPTPDPEPPTPDPEPPTPDPEPPTPDPEPDLDEVIVIMEPEAPLTNIPNTQETVIIEDDQVPLKDNPNTGSLSMAVPIGMAAASFIGLLCLAKTFPNNKKSK